MRSISQASVSDGRLSKRETLIDVGATARLRYRISRRWTTDSQPRKMPVGSSLVQSGPTSSLHGGRRSTIVMLLPRTASSKRTSSALRFSQNSETCRTASSLTAAGIGIPRPHLAPTVLCNDSARSAAIRRAERYGREDNRKVPRRRANAPGPAQEAELLCSQNVSPKHRRCRAACAGSESATPCASSWWPSSFPGSSSRSMRTAPRSGTRSSGGGRRRCRATRAVLRTWRRRRASCA